MADSFIYTLLRMFNACGRWFEQILVATGLKDFYLAAIFVAFSIGFLLSAFRNGLPSGLDSGSDTASKAYRARSSRPYRLGRDHKIH